MKNIKEEKKEHKCDSFFSYVISYVKHFCYLVFGTQVVLRVQFRSQALLSYKPLIPVS